MPHSTPTTLRVLRASAYEPVFSGRASTATVGASSATPPSISTPFWYNFCHRKPAPGPPPPPLLSHCPPL
eukprot:1078758-Prymnesium_polylepis.2